MVSRFSREKRPRYFSKDNARNTMNNNPCISSETMMLVDVNARCLLVLSLAEIWT